jgi:hypothetical protein
MIVAVKKEKYYIFSVCADLVIQHAKRMLAVAFYSVASPAVLYFSTLPHKLHDFREKCNWKYDVGYVFSTTLKYFSF